MRPYGIISDTHHHQWSAFSTTLPSGVNSRLQTLLDETIRCAEEVRAAGGNTIIHAGDLFHVRGSIAPTVLNPTMDCYRGLINKGFHIIILAGNHDLEGKTSERVSSAITALEGVGCVVVNSVNYSVMDEVAMIPWDASIPSLKAKIDAVDPADRPKCDLILHAPIDDVIPGIPPHGLDAAYLKALGFRRIFCGHYHHHKDFGDGVYSIGALAHHTWSDVGTKAGFLIVGPDKDDVTWRASRAPEFVEITPATDPDSIDLIADGNYVRAKIKTTKTSDIEESRDYLMKCGANGVVIVAEKDATVSKRTGATVSAGASIETSVTEFINVSGYGSKAELALLCHEIIHEAQGA